MTIKRVSVPFLIVLMSLTIVSAQESTESDTTQTPFRKGRWFTGLSGNISSNNSRLDNASQKVFSNGYRIDFFNGRFSKDRWLRGFRLNIARTNNNEFADNETETLFAAPSVVHYLSKSSDGSFFVAISVGYVRSFQRSTIQGQSTVSQEVIKGNGYGGEIGLGYSYAITDHVLFDLGIDVNSFRVAANRTLEPSGERTKERLNFGGILLSFGFNVVLDNFFF